MIAESLILSVANAYFYVTSVRLVRRYRRTLGRLPNIANPARYSERMLWRKVIDGNPAFAMFSDKLATKDYLKSRCPDLPVPRTLWTGYSSDDIPDELLRGNVLVKANHGCDFNCRIHDGQCDRIALRKMTDKWLASTYGRQNGEWPYSKVERQLFVEEAVGDIETGLIEFNVRASNGTPVLGSVLGKCKTPDQWAFYLDPDGAPTWGMTQQDGSPITPLPADLKISEPYHRAVQFTQRLSVGVDYARFDFLWNGTELFGGEITLFPAGGVRDPLHSHVHSTILTGWDMLQSHFLKTQHAGLKRIYAGALRRRLEQERSAGATHCHSH